jgi:outer membrane protein assembly factor BamB
MKIDDRLRGHAPKVPNPVPFKGVNGEVKGWKVSVPGARPLATPAISNNRLFLGGGFGSYEFYAFDATDGRLIWQYQTEDDGPTAAVVADDLVCFSTESCELEVLTVDGRRVWKKWLGDPLMSMPAVGQGRIYMAYPDSRGDRDHHLACFDLRTGSEFWKQPIAGEIITAPIIAFEQVYLATLGGEVYCYEAASGRLVWREARNATSSPAVWNGRCYFSRRHEVPLSQAGKSVQQMESMAVRETHADGAFKRYLKTAYKADYLDLAKRKRRSPHFTASELADSCVGFGFSKGDAKMEQAMSNLGQGHVHGVWTYQGSKPFISRGHMYCAQGDCIYSMEPDSEQVLWKQTPYKPDRPEQEVLDSLMTPPAIVNDKLFVGTIQGDLICLSAQTGEELWREKIGEPIVFQPAVSAGRVYVPTANGTLVAIETGDAQDDGWRMWGATPAHNGLIDEDLAPVAASV